MFIIGTLESLENASGYLSFKASNRAVILTLSLSPTSMRSDFSLDKHIKRGRRGMFERELYSTITNSPRIRLSTTLLRGSTSLIILNSHPNLNYFKVTKNFLSFA